MKSNYKICFSSYCFVFNNEAYINLPIYGNDGTTSGIDEGMDPGENFYLKVYDSSEDKYIFYPNDDVIVVDSNSPDKSYFDQVRKLGATPVDAKNVNYTTGNIWHTYNSIYLKKNIKTLVSYHPAFLLRSPQFKKEAWNDLKILQKEINSNAN